MKIALAQINTTVGDFENNLTRALQFLERARSQGADLVVFPELTFSGYPAKDLLEKAAYVERNLEMLHRFKKACTGIAAVVGFISRNERSAGKPLLNSSALLSDGCIVRTAHKCLLPTYDVFDEARHFESCPRAHGLADFHGRRLAFTICEDFWNDADIFPHRIYGYDPVENLAGRGAEIFLNISASPYTADKPAFRERLAVHAAQKYAAPVLFVNQVGGYDDIIFDGGSIAVDAKGRVVGRASSFEEDLLLVDLEAELPEVARRTFAHEELLYRALTLGVRDYTRKSRFKQVVLGLSGGVDSALVACIAADALGPENVIGVAMPSMYSSAHSIEDAEALARNLGLRFEVVPIAPLYDSFLASLAPLFADRPFDATEENLQARIRGTLLMALSNKFGAMVLSTGNKSEMAVGYSTLYGDMCGGLAVISDLFKTEVYRLSRWRNRNGEVIPRSTLEKPPSAELRPGQTDQDDLPPYDVLDQILLQYIEEQLAPAEIAARGFDEVLVRRIANMVDRNEYKRRQAPPGLKVTEKAFGYGRRLPIVQRFQP